MKWLSHINPQLSTKWHAYLWWRFATLARGSYATFEDCPIWSASNEDPGLIVPTHLGYPAAFDKSLSSGKSFEISLKISRLRSSRDMSSGSLRKTSRPED